jgi:hypothetical protein
LPTPTPTYIQNPTADWGNDDLLFQPDTRAYAAAQHPRMLAILDWPELRAKFAGFDLAAGAARRASRRAGVRACVVGFVSLLLAAALPLLKIPYPGAMQVLGPIAAALAALSTIWGYAMVLHGQHKAQWLSNRYWTERLRQLHFQLIINHLPLVVRVIRTEARALAEWDALRAGALARFHRLHVEEVTDAMGRMEADEAENEFCLEPAWECRGDVPAPSPELEEVYTVMVEQRFEIQRRFASLKTAPGNWHSSLTRSAMAKSVSNAMTFLMLLTVIVGGILLGLDYNPDGEAIKWITFATGVSSGVIVLLRVLNEGLQLSSEAERYTWYRAAVTSLKQRFERAQGGEQLEILRDMERLSYQEMRWFMMSFKQAKFIM